MEAHVYSSNSLSVTNNRLELPESVTNGTRTYTVTEIEHFHCGNSSSLELVVPKTVRKVSSVQNGVSKLVLGSGVNSVSEMHQCYVQEFEKGSPKMRDIQIIRFSIHPLLHNAVERVYLFSYPFATHTSCEPGTTLKFFFGKYNTATLWQ